MASDIVFKNKLFGGFDKEEVMTYINTLLSEKTELENRVSSLNSQIAQLNVKLSVLEFRANESDGLKERNTALTAENKSLKEHVLNYEQIKTQYEELKADADKSKAQCEVLRAELESSGYTIDEVEALKKENSRLTAENTKIKSMEQQVGAAMLDARLHSDELVKIAREKANKVTQEIYSAIGDTAVKIDSLSSDIGDIARNFTKAAEDAELRINVLTGNMSKTAQALLYDSNFIDEAPELTSSDKPDNENHDVVKPHSDGFYNPELSKYFENISKNN